MAENLANIIEQWVLLKCPYEDIKKEIIHDINLRRKISNRGPREEAIHCNRRKDNTRVITNADEL